MIRSIFQDPSIFLVGLWNAYRDLLVYAATVLVIIFLLWFVWGIILRKLKGNVSPELYNGLRTLGRGTILLLGLFWVLGDEFFIAAAALLGTAIGFASTTTIGNFISGIYLLVTNPFSVGDYIMLPGFKVEGIVEEVSINYTRILTPQGTHVIITNQKLLGAVIYNTHISVPQEAISKGKITWRDDETDKFDSVEDVIDIFKGIRARYALKDKDYYFYPLVYKLNPDKYAHSRTKLVFEKAIQEFNDRTVEPITWILLDRSNYQLNLVVENPYLIFDLKSEILGYLEIEMEKAHSAS